MNVIQITNRTVYDKTAELSLLRIGKHHPANQCAVGISRAVNHDDVTRLRIVERDLCHQIIPGGYFHGEGRTDQIDPIIGANTAEHTVHSLDAVAYIAAGDLPVSVDQLRAWSLDIQECAKSYWHKALLLNDVLRTCPLPASHSIPR